MNSAPSPTLQELFREGAGYLEAREVPSPRFDAQVLLAHALGISRSDLLQRAGETAPEAISRHYWERLRRRGERVPLQHLTGVQEFWSLEFEVSPAALIPRPETELLVEEALRQGAGPSARIADIGTGSGNIAVALARELPAARIVATDTSAQALELARRNAQRHGVAGRIQFLQGDLAEPLSRSVERESLDLLLSNPPYVSIEELATLQPEVREYEPKEALTPPGRDGLALYPPLLDAAALFLRPGGAVILELPAGGAERIPALMAGRESLELLTVRADYSGILRVMVARRRLP
ncbi:MAG: peptide chain release factor N(5)-glutamine methyltransferase [Acidobacteria bacterium]|nr:peptide chain release factor N(5)-glutamine methyltransferase [Acidobacteriota bacterium]